MHSTHAPLIGQLINQQLIDDINRHRQTLETICNNRLVEVEEQVVQLGAEDLARACYEFCDEYKSLLDQPVEGYTLSKVMDQISIGDSNLRDIMESVAKTGQNFSVGSTGCSEYLSVFKDVLAKLPKKKRSYDYVPIKRRRIKAPKTPQDNLEANLKTYWNSYNTPSGKASVYLKKCQQSILTYLDKLDADFKKGELHELKDRVGFSKKIHGELLFQHVHSNLKAVLDYVWAQAQIQKGQSAANLTITRNGSGFIATSDTGESYSFSYEGLEGFRETINAISRVWRRFDEESQQWLWICAKDSEEVLCGDTLGNIFNDSIDPWLNIANSLLASRMASHRSSSSLSSSAVIGDSLFHHEETLLLPSRVSPASASEEETITKGYGVPFRSLSIETGGGAMAKAAEVTPTPTGRGSSFFSGDSESVAFKDSGGAFDVLLAAIETVEGQSATSSPTARGF